MRRAIKLLLITSMTTALAAPAAISDASSRHHLWAKIRRTEFGIPHILAHSWKGLGFGYGYAFAHDNICTIARDYVTVDAGRARWFGPDGSYLQGGNGIRVNNLDSDVFFQSIIDSRIIPHLLKQPPPAGPKPVVKRAVRGYVAGYNRFLHDVGGSKGVHDPRCRGEAWVRPITTKEVWRRFYQLVLLAGYDVVIDGIAHAQPPTPGSPAPSFDPAATARAIAAGWRGVRGGLGSNAVAIGSRGTRNGRGLLLGNPHFPWHGPERFYQSQLTIPGKVNVSGASLYGVPAILIGHTSTLAWSHTVSTAFRFTPYQLTLQPGDPTKYMLDGTARKMQARKVTVLSRKPDGSLEKVTRTLWWTRYGPVFTNLVGVPLPWTPTTAFAIRDVNARNFRVLNHFFAFDRAHTVRQALAILKRYQGIPWVNTIVADRSGQTLYADIGAIPHVTDRQASDCDTPVGLGTYSLIGLPVLDGSRKQCDWGRDEDSVAPGTFGPSHEPYLLRRDFVTNSNDSYWLSNPHHPLTGYPRIIGTERSARTLRTRMGLVMTEARITGKDHLGPRGFDRGDMRHMVFSNFSYAAMITKHDLVGMCRQDKQNGGAPTSDGGMVAVGDACKVLVRWSMRENLGAKGAILFRRFWDHASDAEASPFRRPFDEKDPVHTPRGLDTGNPQVQQAFGDAIRDLRAAHLPLGATVASQQYVVKDGRRIPIFGGSGDPHGDFNAIWTSWVAGKGLTRVSGGSSYVQVVTWGANRCPRTSTILTYSESENPASRHYLDQTLLFSRHRWVRERFCRRQILASPALRVHTISR